MERRQFDNLLNSETEKFLDDRIKMGLGYFKGNLIARKNILDLIDETKATSQLSDIPLIQSWLLSVPKEIESMTASATALEGLKDTVNQMLHTGKPITLPEDAMYFLLGSDEEYVEATLFDVKDSYGYEVTDPENAPMPWSGSITRIFKGKQIAAHVKYGREDYENKNVVPTDYPTSMVLIPIREDYDMQGSSTK